MTSVKLTIDGREVEADAGETILLAARRLGIEIPTLCYMEGRPPLETCGVCMVEIEPGASSKGRDPRLVPACATRVSGGISVRTDTERVHRTRRGAIELMLSDHLGDCVGPCESGCPARIDIPRMLEGVAAGDPKGAMATVLESVAFPGVLGRICPAPCELTCRRRELDEPISIRAVKRYVADRVRTVDAVPAKAPASGKRVAVVGAGIAGLSAAFFLQVSGHAVTVFEKRDRPGGGLRAIPPFRLPGEVLGREIGTLLSLGVQIRTGLALGRDFSLDDLLRDYAAVLLATGLREPRLEDEATSALDLLFELNDELNEACARGESSPDDRGPFSRGKRAPGIAMLAGSGRAGVDACRTLVRLGAERVILLPERPPGPLARPELVRAQSEGVEVLPPGEVLDSEGIGQGRVRVAYAGGEGEKSIEVDAFYLAPRLEANADALKTSTGRQGVFVAGGVTRPQGLAVHSAAAGRRAAREIDSFLRGEPLPRDPVRVRMGKLSDETKEALFAGFRGQSRGEVLGLSPGAAKESFRETELGLDEGGARREAAACLRCDCAKKDSCRLRELATEYGAEPGRYGPLVGEARPAFERDGTHPDIVYEPAKCVKCGRCAEIAERAGEPVGIAFLGRGAAVRVGVPLGGTLGIRGLQDGLRSVALRAARECPTGALYVRRDR